jgi:hypothetical protein
MHRDFTPRTGFTYFFPHHRMCNQSAFTTWPLSLFHHHSCHKSHFASSHTPDNNLVVLSGKYFSSHLASMAAQCQRAVLCMAQLLCNVAISKQMCRKLCFVCDNFQHFLCENLSQADHMANMMPKSPAQQKLF